MSHEAMVYVKKLPRNSVTAKQRGPYSATKSAL
jgi:hypothetical protein